MVMRYLRRLEAAQIPASSFLDPGLLPPHGQQITTPSGRDITLNSISFTSLKTADSNWFKSPRWDLGLKEKISSFKWVNINKHFQLIFDALKNSCLIGKQRIVHWYKLVHDTLGRDWPMFNRQIPVDIQRFVHYKQTSCKVVAITWNRSTILSNSDMSVCSNCNLLQHNVALTFYATLNATDIVCSFISSFHSAE